MEVYVTAHRICDFLNLHSAYLFSLAPSPFPTSNNYLLPSLMALPGLCWVEGFNSAPGLYHIHVAPQSLPISLPHVWPEHLSHLGEGCWGQEAQLCDDAQSWQVMLGTWAPIKKLVCNCMWTAVFEKNISTEVLLKTNHGLWTKFTAHFFVTWAQ